MQVTTKIAQTLPSTAWKEVIEPYEQMLFEGFAREIAAMQREVAADTGEPLRRGFHAKAHAGLIAEFQVLADLPEYARFGVFSVPRVFPALVRFSNGEPALQSDTKPQPRGIAIKLVGVPGPKLLSAEESAVTQDFLATSHSVTSTVRNVKQFMAFIRANRNRLTMPLTLARAVGTRESLRILRLLVTTVLISRVRSMATEQFSSTAPIKLGPYAVKYTLRPSANTEAPKNRPLATNFLRDELAERLRNGDILFDFVIQFYTDDIRTPIEDTSILWNAPFLKVAQLRIPQCDLDDQHTGELSDEVDRLSFSPWHATDDHRPLGTVMRARRVAYEASSVLRGHSPEPTALPLAMPHPS